MVTGFEATGLALAIFPIVLQGIAKAKGLKDQDGASKRLVRELKMEKCKFVNTSHTLLGGMSVSEERIQVLVSGKGWEDFDFQVQLEQHLGQELANAFTESVEALHSSLKDLSKDIGLDRHRKPRWKKLKAVLQLNDYDAVLQKIDKINRDLAQLTMQRQRTSTIHTHARPSAVVQHYNHIRSHATRLYEVFQDKFNTCRASHNGTHSASLRLSRAIPHRTGESDLSLTVLFDFDEASGTLPWDWREIYFMPIDRRRHGQRVSEDVRGRGCGFASGLDSVNERVSPAGRRSRIGKAIVTADVGLIGGSETGRITDTTKSKKTVGFQVPIQKETRPPTSFDESDLEATQGIEDFCSAIAGTTGESLTVCIGTLADEWHCIRPPRPASSSPYLQKTVSLHDLLIPGCLEKKVRLQLGVELALAVMQFHTTEWLKESWSNQDISFLQKSRNLPGGIEISEPVADKPIVRRIFGQPKSAPLAEPELFQYDKSLFSLGIVLIELWCERRIDELREPSQTSIPFNDSAVYATAQRLVGDIFSTAGDLYGLAVSRCLNGLNRPIESTQAERRNLENSKFKNEVQADIISLLERNLEVYTAGI